MDSPCISSIIDGFKPNHELVTLNYDQYSDPVMNFGFMDDSILSPDTDYAGNPAPASTISTDVNSPLNESDFTGTVLGYINQMLMEEDMEEKPCMFHDSLALQAAEESLYEVIGEKYPSDSSNQHHPLNYQHVGSPEESLSCSFSDRISCGSFATTSTANSVESHWSNVDLSEYKPSLLQATFPDNFVFQSPSTSTQQFSMNSISRFISGRKYNTFMGNYRSGFSDSTLSESVLQFERGVEAASKFLPKDNPLMIDLEANVNSPSLRNYPQVVIKRERDESEQEDEIELDGRSKKQSADCMDDGELSELFDKVLIGTGWGKEPPLLCICHNNAHTCVQRQKDEESSKCSEGKSRVRRQTYKQEVVDLDLRTVLIQCAQAVSSEDRWTANKLLNQIRQHSSSTGSASQRLAHCFADALEARLNGTGSQIHTALSSKRTSAADMVKAYQMYITACPFHKIAIIFANHTILHMASEVETLHIIDFGIRYGFQWPALIFRLSKLPGGPPKLRITGIDLPQGGFRPAERVQATGRRLARYCKRFNVPFEYNAIAQKWETIRIEDLKMNKNEHVVVNCMLRFKNLLDETVAVNSPRDAVLRLIRKANPRMFLQTEVNGCYNAPFFLTRFREALFHYSSAFDVLDTNVDSKDPMRLMFEKEFFGREVMNIIACEGFERVERPETYKQWQVRNTKAGFRQLPLDHHLITNLRGKLREVYHSDFMLDEDRNWMLQGWKGRITYASSCWVPA